MDNNNQIEEPRSIRVANIPPRCDVEVRNEEKNAIDFEKLFRSWITQRALCVNRNTLEAQFITRNSGSLVLDLKDDYESEHADEDQDNIAFNDRMWHAIEKRLDNLDEETKSKYFADHLPDDLNPEEWILLPQFNHAFRAFRFIEEQDNLETSMEIEFPNVLDIMFECDLDDEFEEQQRQVLADFCKQNGLRYIDSSKAYMGFPVGLFPFSPGGNACI